MAYTSELSAEEKEQFNAMKNEDQTIPDPIIEENPPEEPVIDPKEKEEPIADVKNTMVPHAAMHEEREARKAAEREAKELREQFARADERMKVLAALHEPQEKQEIPDPDIDAIGALKYTQRELKLLRDQNQKRELQQQEVQYIAQVASSAASQEREYVAANPDYAEAANFLVQSRFNELKELGASDQQAQQTVEQEKFSLAYQAQQNGKNPAEIVHRMAKLRGFQPKSLVQPQDNIQRISEGQRANISLSTASGTPANSKGPSAKEIGQMPQEEFNAYVSKLSRKQRMELLGGA